MSGVVEQLLAEVRSLRSELTTLADRVAAHVTDELREQLEAILATAVPDSGELPPAPRPVALKGVEYVGPVAREPAAIEPAIKQPAERAPVADDRAALGLDSALAHLEQVSGWVGTGDLRRAIGSPRAGVWARIGTALRADLRVDHRGNMPCLEYRWRKVTEEPADEAPAPRTIASMRDAALAALVGDPGRDWSSGELRQHIGCPEGRWPLVARAMRSDTRIAVVHSSRGPVYQAATGRPDGNAALARRMAELLAASGREMLAGELRVALGLKSETRWRCVLEHLVDHPQVKAAGNRGGRRYRWAS